MREGSGRGVGGAIDSFGADLSSGPSGQLLPQARPLQNWVFSGESGAEGFFDSPELRQDAGPRPPVVARGLAGQAWTDSGRHVANTARRRRLIAVQMRSK